MMMSEVQVGRWVWCTLAMLLLVSPARADSSLEVAELRQVADLSSRVGLLRDESAALTLDQARSQKTRFRDNEGRSLTLGFDEAAVWLRLPLHNGAPHSVRWLLEVGEPSLEHVDLYLVRADGTVRHSVVGTAFPFASRPLQYTRPVFEIENAPRESCTLYLRVQSDQILRTPLRAYEPDFYRRQHRGEEGLALFCLGALLLVALYNLGLFAMVRRIEHMWFAALSFGIWAVMMGLGQRFGQLFFPHHAGLAARATPVSCGLAAFCFVWFIVAITQEHAKLARVTRVFRKLGLGSAGLLLFVTLAPVGLALRVLAVAFVSFALIGPYILHVLRRHEMPEMRWYSRALYGLIAAILVNVLRYAGWLPDNRFTEYFPGVSLVLYCLANAGAFAAFATHLRSQVAGLNQKLVADVAESEQALLRAEQAHQNALAATRAKDEFIATMSHELRTPLNTIINIPQGLAGEFAEERAARCTVCSTNYLLDEAETVDGQVACEQCGARGTLVEYTKVRYFGDGARARRFLQKIERAGQHLLELVNHVLDFSKLEAGRLQLIFGPVDLSATLREVVADMQSKASRRGVQLVLELPALPGPPRAADEARLVQVLGHLIDNAIKFSPAGGQVKVRWACQEDEDLLVVEDDGIGIAPSDHERIFASFEQVDKGDTRKYGGTGLGLPIARALVRMHGGDITVRSSPGRGSSFLVHLPRRRVVQAVERAS